MLTSFLLATVLSTPVWAHTPPKPGLPTSGMAHAVAHPQDAVRRERLRRMLSIRDVAPACAVIAQQSDARLVSDLQWLMDHIKAPPWVGVRAAQCIIELHADTEVERIIGWVQDPSQVGLTLVVLGALNQVAPKTAVPIAKAALAGPHAEKVRPRLVKSQHAEVRALPTTLPAQ